ncbi:hypothetical protein [Streptomyces sp. NPDC091259]|uniref:hypothetical protein n=1 Tax=Streptomyces sp. NPDC091259 TaxID=3365976 RepID=UPI00381F29B9
MVLRAVMQPMLAQTAESPPGPAALCTGWPMSGQLDGSRRGCSLRPTRAGGQLSPLVALTAGSNRSEGDQDPAQSLPLAPDALCRYGAEWTAELARPSAAPNVPASHAGPWRAGSRRSW